MNEFDTVLFQNYYIYNLTEIIRNNTENDSDNEPLESDEQVNTSCTGGIYSENHPWDIRMANPPRYRFRPDIWCTCCD